MADRRHTGRARTRGENPDGDGADARGAHRLYTVAQVAELLAVSVAHLRREIRLRKLAVVRLGRAIRIAEDAIEAYVARRSRPAR